MCIYIVCIQILVHYIIYLYKYICIINLRVSILCNILGFFNSSNLFHSGSDGVTAHPAIRNHIAMKIQWLKAKNSHGSLKIHRSSP